MVLLFLIPGGYFRQNFEQLNAKAFIGVGELLRLGGSGCGVGLEDTVIGHYRIVSVSYDSFELPQFLSSYGLQW